MSTCPVSSRRRERDRFGLLAGPHRAREAVDRAVGDADGLVLVVVAEDREDRAEDLLLGDRHVGGDVGEDGRADEVALLGGGFGAARNQARALGDALLDVTAHPGLLFGVDDRADAGAVLGGCRRGQLHRLVVLVAVDEHAGPSAARLAGVGHHVGDADVDGLGEVGAREDDVGGLAAELQGDLLHRGARRRADLAAHRRGAGEGDEVDARVFGEGLSRDRAEAGDEVEDARRDARLVDRLGEQLGGERGVFGGLQHHRAARREGRGDLGDDLVEGVVPGGDRADHADRLLVDRRVADLLLEGVGRGEFGVRTRDRDRHAGVDGLREGERRAEFGGDGLGDLVFAGRQHVPQGGQLGGAFGGRGRGPARKGGTGGPYGGVDVGGGTGRDAVDHLLVERVHHVDGVPARGGAPGAVDVHAVVCLHRAASRA